MRFHVVGVGAIGSLVSFHLKRLNRRLIKDAQALRSLPHPWSVPLLPAPQNHGIILHLRKVNIATQIINKADSGIVVEREGSKERELGFSIRSGEDYQKNMISKLPPLTTSSLVEGLPGSSRLEELGYPKGSIDTLIVTTKANVTMPAMRPLLPFITPATTIVLIQNGQGVMDTLLENFFPDPANRPHFILANTTHGAWIKGKMHCVHAAYGKLELAIVPNRTIGKHFEQFLGSEDEGNSTLQSNSEFDKPLQQSEGYSEQERRQEGSQERSFSTQRRGLSTSTSIPRLRPPAILDINAIPNLPSTQTLIQTMSVLLNLPLAVTWHPIQRYQMIALKKLVVNACINPITALVECRNGDLFGNRSAETTIRDLCREISEILEALALKVHQRELKKKQEEEEQRRRLDEDGDFDTSKFILSSSRELIENSSLSPLDNSLKSSALFLEVQRVIRLTAPNYSSMLQDVQKVREGTVSTEIQYINGYFSRLGQSLGIKTPINDLMTRLVTIKSSRTTRPWKK